MMAHLFAIAPTGCPYPSTHQDDQRPFCCLFILGQVLTLPSFLISLCYLQMLIVLSVLGSED